MAFNPYVEVADRPDQTIEELARANRFTIEELKQNRKGKIADTQWIPLVRRALRPVRFTGSALLSWLLFSFIVNRFIPRIVMFIAALLGSDLFVPIYGAVTLACVGAFITAIVRSTHRVTLLVADLRNGKAATIEGRTSPSREETPGLGLSRLYGESQTTWWYVIHNQYFEVTEDAYKSLPPGRFRLYHTPLSKMLLSIEPT